MTVSVVNPISSRRTRPYITPDIFRTHARAGVQTNTLVPKGTPADNEAALADFIEQGAAWIDLHAEQTFAASVDRWAGWLDVGGDGMVQIFPRFAPVIGLMSFASGWSADGAVAMTSLAGTTFTENSFTLPAQPGLGRWSSEGMLQFGPAVSWPGGQAYVDYQYQHGYPVTLMTGASVTAGQQVVPVEDTTGFVAGQTYATLRAGQARFRSLVTAVSTADAGGLGTGPGTITLADPLPATIINPSIPVQVDGLLDFIITANVLTTRALIRGKTPATSERGKNRQTTPGDDYHEAWDLIRRAQQVIH